MSVLEPCLAPECLFTESYMSEPIKPRHFISLDQFTAAEVEDLLTLAAELKREIKSKKATPRLSGKSLAMLFLQPSNRTRVSFEVGMYQLGGNVVNIRPEEIKLGQREPVADVARVLSRYVDGVMMRVVKHEHITEFAEWSSVPVINGLSDRCHPCQALSDMLTILEHKGRLRGINLCYVGDGNNVCNSLIHAAHLLGVNMSVCCPQGYEPTLSQENWSYRLFHKPEEAVQGADVIYTDVWTSMGFEEETARRLKRFKGYAVTESLLKLADKEVIFMHCLPAHRGEEVTHEVVESKHSVVFDQAENRLHAQKAVLARLL